VQLIKFGAYIQFSVPKPPLLLAANRYAQLKKASRTNSTFVFLPPRKPAQKKTKRAVFCQRTKENEQNEENHKKRSRMNCTFRNLNKRK
jgi:hypothetical protein